MTNVAHRTAVSHPSFHDYFELCNPRVVGLMLVTSTVAMILATPAHEWPSLHVLLWGNLGIAFAGFAGGIINHLVDRHIDQLMARTKKRPLPSGRVPVSHAILLAIILACVSMFILITCINMLTAVLSFLTLIGYAGVYTLYLKHATPQNIVIGGLAGAMPPLLGWVAVTHHIDAAGLLLVLIIFTWTPPHFWALAIYRYKEYAKASIPMLPVTHGIRFTKLSILLYTLLMVAATYLPFIIMMSGLIYLIGVSLLNIIFLYYAIALYRHDEPRLAFQTFKFSIYYLFTLFILLLADHYLRY